VEEWGDNLLLWARIITGGAFLIIGWRNIDNQKLIAGLIRSQKWPLPDIAAWFGIGMQIVFGALMISGLTFLKQYALGLTIAVLLDAFVIRATLVPAVMRLAGNANWWAPRPLRRLHTAVGLSDVRGPERTAAR